jgi:hypothetical protein
MILYSVRFVIKWQVDIQLSLLRQIMRIECKGFAYSKGFGYYFIVFRLAQYRPDCMKQYEKADKSGNAHAVFLEVKER